MINNSSKFNPTEYYQIKKKEPPRPLLTKAVEYVSTINKAIDIGGGALQDSEYLLELGFDVTVVDEEPLSAQRALEINSPKLHHLTQTFESFAWPKNEYNLASAMKSLPFNPPATFNEVFENVKESLVPGGIVCGHLFGMNDEWSSGKKMTFHTKEQVQDLLADLETISLTETEEDSVLANGTPKHWHFFEFIARKHG